MGMGSILNGKKGLFGNSTLRAMQIITAFGVIGVLFCCYADGISGNDFWWHVKVGEYIVTNRTIPTSDIFSWYATSLEIPWTAHEWLSEVIFYLVYRFAGSLGIFLLSFLAATALSFLVWARLRKAATNPIFTEIFLLLFAAVAGMFIFGRPQLFNYFLLFFELTCLFDFFEDRSSRKIWLLPVISMLWSNLHGGSSNLAYLLCLLFLVGGLPRKGPGRLEATPLSRADIRKLVLVTVCTAAATLINPIGLRVFVFPYTTLADSVSMNNISEWLAPDAKNLMQLLLFYVPILFVSLMLVITKKKIRCIDLLVFLFFSYLFFRSVRFIMLWFLAAAFFAMRYAPERGPDRPLKQFEKAVCAVLCLVLVVSLGFSVAPTVQLAKTDSLISTVMSDEAIEAIREDAPQRLYNDYNFGEALIFNDISVFYDARADMYAESGILADGFSLSALMDRSESKEKDLLEDSGFDVNALLEKYDFDSFVIQKNRPLYVYLASHGERYKLVYEDNKAAYFRVTETEAVS